MPATAHLSSFHRTLVGIRVTPTPPPRSAEAAPPQAPRANAEGAAKGSVAAASVPRHHLRSIRRNTMPGGFAAIGDTTLSMKAIELDEPAIDEPLTPMQRLARAEREVRASLEGDPPNVHTRAALRDAYGLLHLLREMLAMGDPCIEVDDIVRRWHHMDNAHALLQVRAALKAGAA